MQSQAEPEVRREHEDGRMSLQLINNTIRACTRSSGVLIPTRLEFQRNNRNPSHKLYEADK